MKRSSIGSFIPMAVIVASASFAACSRTPYACSSNAQCDHTAGSICTVDHQCAEPSATCVSHYAYARSARDPGACVPASTLGDGGDVVIDADASMDAADVDAPTIDVPVGVDTPGGEDVPIVDATTGCPIPRLTYPLSGSRLTSNHPELRVAPAPEAGASTVDYEFGDTYNSTHMLAVMPIGGARDTVSVVPSLIPGIHYWRARRHCQDTGTVSDWSATWWFTVPFRESMTVASSVVPGPAEWNGDGIADYAIGSPGNRAVYLYTGAPGSTPTEFAVQRPAGDAYFGASVANAGDVDGDGQTELLVGACAPPDQRASSGACSHTIWIMRRGNPDWIVTPLATPSQYAIGAYGGPMAGVGDLDGDGYGDIAVGTGVVGDTTGTVLLYFGSPTGLATTPLAIPGGPAYGRAVAAGGEVDRSLRNVVVVGGLGSAAIIRVGTDRRAMSVPLMFSGTPDFGSAVSSAGDRNADGYPDIVVGSAQESAAFTFETLLANTTISRRVSSTFATDTTAYAIAGSGDYDADGYDDVLLGSPGAMDVDANDGAVHIFRGAPSTDQTLTTLRRGISGHHQWGSALAFVGRTELGNGDVAIVAAPDVRTSAARTTGGEATRVYWNGSALFTVSLRAFIGNAGQGFGASISH